MLNLKSEKKIESKFPWKIIKIIIRNLLKIFVSSIPYQNFTVIQLN